MALTQHQTMLLNLFHHAGQNPGYGPDGSQPYHHTEDQTGGGAEQRYWAMHDKKYQAGYQNGGKQARPIPNVRKRKPRPIPNANGLGGVNRGTRST